MKKMKLKRKIKERMDREEEDVEKREEGKG